jgi:SNF2 family DNA or RNA helicase
VKDPETDEYISLPHGPRTSVLLEAIEQASAKVIVVVPFKGIIRELEGEVSKHHSVAVLNGDVSPKMRDSIIKAFKETPDPHVLLCHPKVMAHGLNLTEADTLIFYAPIYSNDEFQQVTERFNRAGQKRKMTIIRIAAHAVEWKIYAMVDNKKTTQDNILNLYETITNAHNQPTES